MEAVKQNSSQHGDLERSFEMIADLWTDYIGHVCVDDFGVRLRARDVAHMMAILKIVRSTIGDPSEPDHYVDSAGYESLAYELANRRKPDVE